MTITTFKDIKFNGTFWRRHVNTANNIYWYTSIIQDNAKSYILGALRYHYNINNNTWYLSNYTHEEPSVIIDYIPDVELFYLENCKDLSNNKNINNMTSNMLIENLKLIQSNPNYYIDVEGNVYDSDLKVLRSYIGANGSYVVTLQKTLNRKNRIDNKRNLIIARLLLEHFVRKPTKKDVALFIDGNKLNHKLSNLKWGTSRDVHAVKFDDETILNIKERLSEGTSQIQIAKEFGISYGHLSKIKRGITRTYLK